MRTHVFSRKGLVGTTAVALAGALLVGGAYTGTPHQAVAPATTIHTQPVAFNTITNSISLNLDASGPTAVSRYNAAINAIRNRVRDSRIVNNYRHGTLYDSIIEEAPSNVDDYFAVHLQDANGAPQVSLIMNAANLYVVGFWNHADNTYYRMGLGPNNPTTAATVSNDWLTSGHYTYLTGPQAGNFNRQTQVIGLSNIRNAIRGLRTPESTRAEDARSITMLITAFAEAARFDYISARVAQAIEHGTGWSLGTTGVAYTNSWSSLSGYVRSRLQDRQPVNYWVDQTHLTTLQQIAQQLAVALMSATWTYSRP
ncbi:ribosome-inactivating family protein [Streptomyces sp. NPDC020951]|uniref:ribosome-inactivating family protein n=1 Tax=Streptomyces sp. NPDC020951 TaxID=3365104 RepID=UPI00379498F0